MGIRSIIIGEEQDILGILSRFKKRDFKGNTGQAIKNSSFQLATTITAKIGSMLFTIIIARMLLPDLFGLYGLALSTIVLFSSFSDFGIGSAIITFLGKSESEGKHSKARAYFSYLLKWKFILTLLCSLALLLFAHYISNNIYDKPLFLALLAGALYIPAMSFLQSIESTFVTLNNFKYSWFKELIFQILRLVFVPLGILFFISRDFSTGGVIAGIILILSLCYLIPLLFLLILTRKKLSFLKSKKEKLTKQEKKEIFLFLIPLSVTLLAGLFFGQIDVVMLGHFVESNFIGFYQAAFALIGSASAVIGFAAGALFPIFVRLKGKQLERGLNKSLKLTFLISLAAAIFTYFIAPYVIRLVYGEEYMQAVPLLQIFSILMILIPITGIYGAYFISTRQTKSFAWIIIIATIVNIVLNYLFIIYSLQYGMIYSVIGVCVATVISKLVYLGGLIIFRKKQK